MKKIIFLTLFALALFTGLSAASQDPPEGSQVAFCIDSDASDALQCPVLNSPAFAPTLCPALCILEVVHFTVDCCICLNLDNSYSNTSIAQECAIKTQGAGNMKDGSIYKDSGYCTSCGGLARLSGKNQ